MIVVAAVVILVLILYIMWQYLEYLDIELQKTKEALRRMERKNGKS